MGPSETRESSGLLRRERARSCEGERRPRPLARARARAAGWRGRGTPMRAIQGRSRKPKPKQQQKRMNAAAPAVFGISGHGVPGVGRILPLLRLGRDAQAAHQLGRFSGRPGRAAAGGDGVGQVRPRRARWGWGVGWLDAADGRRTWRRSWRDGRRRRAGTWLSPRGAPLVGSQSHAMPKIRESQWRMEISELTRNCERTGRERAGDR